MYRDVCLPVDHRVRCIILWYMSTLCVFLLICFFFQAEDGIRDLVRSRGLGDVYKRQTD